jgi:hypothetical protein
VAPEKYASSPRRVMRSRSLWLSSIQLPSSVVSAPNVICSFIGALRLFKRDET